MDSPRGRIYLMNMLNEGEAAMTPKWVQHMDACLGCVSCMTACPSGVNYGKLIEETRAVIEHQYVRPWRERLLRWAILHTFPNVSLLRVGRVFLAAYQKLGLPSPNQLMPKLGKREDVSGWLTPARGVEARAGGIDAGMRPARIPAGDQCGDGAGAGGGGLRSGGPGGAAVLRGAVDARGQG